MFILPIELPSHYEWQMPHQECASNFNSQALQRPAEAKPHLILYFDMNKTLIASDREGQKTAHDVICAEISNRVTDRWEKSLLTPITYADYVEKYLFPDHSLESKCKQKAQLSAVLDVLKERNHPAYLQMKELYDHSLDLLDKQKTQVFPSFYKLIEFLQKESIPYTLVIRTFGSEAPEIAQELNAYFGDNFLSDFRTLKQNSLQGKESDLYKLVVQSDHHLVIQDDWEWWSQHDLYWKYGKPFPVDLNDSQHISLFFDDNALIDPLVPEKNIVYPYDALTGKPIPPHELIEKGQLCPVDMLEALCNEDYYIRFVQEMIKN